MLNLTLKSLLHRPGRAAGLSRAKPRAGVSWGHFRDSEAENASISALSAVWGGPPDLLRWRRRGLCLFRRSRDSRARFSGVVWSGQIRCAFSVIFGRLVVKPRASDTPWAVASVHRGRDIKNARNTKQ